MMASRLRLFPKVAPQLSFEKLDSALQPEATVPFLGPSSYVFITILMQDFARFGGSVPKCNSHCGAISLTSQWLQ
jgi:hypothetical protein